MLAAALALAPALAPAPVEAASSVEGKFVSMLNAQRKDAGLEGLSIYWDLEDDARRHSVWMAKNARTATIPNRDGVTEGWSRLAEFEGVGFTIHEAFQTAMSTEPFRSEVLTTHDRVGVGIVKNSHGRFFVTVILMTTCSNGE